MRIHSIAGLSVLAVSAGAAFGCAPDTGEEPVATSSAALGDGKGHLKKGEQVFNGEFPGVQGNGRACATCHVEEDGFGLTPAHVEARFQALEAARQTDPNADDPLFRSIDANDGASNFTNLRKGLVRVVITLPTDASGQKLVWPADDPNATEASVWRSVPSVLNVALTAPYQLDGRVATLEDQALGALRGHAEIKHDPNPDFLSDVAEFQKGLFSSPGVASVASALAQGETPPNPDPALTPVEAQGKALFGGFCANCHGGPTQTRPLPPFADRQNVLISKPLPPPAAGITFLPSPLAPRLWTFRLPNGATQTVPSTDPGKALISGRIAELNQFDVPSLFGVSKTAPYFHDNSAATLEQVLTQYIGFFQFLQRVPPPPGLGKPPVLTQPQADKIVAYLRKI